MTEGRAQAEASPAVIMVPCASSERVGCQIVRRAVDLLVAETPEARALEAADCPRRGKRFVVAVDGSTACQASAVLAACGVRPSAVVSAPEVLARAGLVKPGIDLRSRIDELAEALAAAVRGFLQEALDEVRERRRYQQEMAPVMGRFQGIWPKLEALPSPDGLPGHQDRRQVELLGRRSRNLFVKFDEIVPPAQWAEPHDLFQDALLCIAYACEGWVAGDAERWKHNMEKAHTQIRPLMRRLAG